MAFLVPTKVPIPPSPPPPSKDILWKQYELHIGLYKTYLEFVLKFNVFYYAATGAIISYYFAHSDILWMKYSLLFPVLMSFGFATFFIYGACKIGVVRDELEAIGSKLGFDTVPEYLVLTIFLIISATLMVIVALSLLFIMSRVHPSVASPRP
ncbi:MAG: hypothetical protein LAN18_13315 [Acidobacteriia bacterium]|nr:hypothetical protein [Terriglobia bacterium]